MLTKKFLGANFLILYSDARQRSNKIGGRVDDWGNGLPRWTAPPTCKLKNCSELYRLNALRCIPTTCEVDMKIWYSNIQNWRLPMSCGASATVADRWLKRKPLAYNQ